MVARCTCSRLDILAPHELPDIALKALNIFVLLFERGRSKLTSRLTPKKVAVLESERSSLPILSLTLASILFLWKRIACDLLVDILKPLNKNLAVSFSCFCMRDVISSSLEPVDQRAMSSAYWHFRMNTLLLLILFIIIIVVIIANIIIIIISCG